MLLIPRSKLATLTALCIMSIAASLPIASPAQAGGLVWDRDDDLPCWTDHRMRQFLAAQGYTDIKLNSPTGTNWHARATNDGLAYLVVVDTCNSWIRQRTRLGAN